MQTDLPSLAALTARLVYVQSCSDCRTVVLRFANHCICDPSIASAQLIASKKNHCCENGDALSRLAPPKATPPTAAELFGPESGEAILERRYAEEEAQWCPHSMLPEHCLICAPVSDTNGTIGPFDLPNGFDQ